MWRKYRKKKKKKKTSHNKAYFYVSIFLMFWAFCALLSIIWNGDETTSNEKKRNQLALNVFQAYEMYECIARNIQNDLDWTKSSRYLKWKLKLKTQCFFCVNMCVHSLWFEMKVETLISQQPIRQIYPEIDNKFHRYVFGTLLCRCV